MKLPDDFQYPDGRVFDLDAAIEPTKEQDIINWLKNENAYLRGIIKAYEKLLKGKGCIEEEDED